MSSSKCQYEALQDAALPEGFCVGTLPVEVQTARSIVPLSDPGRLLVLERGKGVTLLEEVNDIGDSGTSGGAASFGTTVTSRLIATAPGLSHGLALHDGFLYASSDSTLYRWFYHNDETFADVGPVQTVINNINNDGRGNTPSGNHYTRTLAWDAQGRRLYVSVGSVSNVDPDSQRSRIRRFPSHLLQESNSENFPLDFLTGEIFADGLRNEVGLAFDRHGVLWGVENGADNLQRADLGGVITNDNPGEELHRFPPENVGAHFGYPYCWTEYQLDEPYAQGRGTAWAWPSFLSEGTVTDESCRNEYAPAELSMQAHSAPLGIAFYQWKNETDLPASCTGGGAFPSQMDGYAFVAFHGSWNREIPTGYKVVYIPMSESGRATNEPLDLLAHDGTQAKWDDGFRPVDVQFDPCGRLWVSSDGTRGTGGSKIVRIEYHHGNPTSDIPTIPPQTPSPTQSNAPAYTTGGYALFWMGIVLLTRGFI